MRFLLRVELQDKKHRKERLRFRGQGDIFRAFLVASEESDRRLSDVYTRGTDVHTRVTIWGLEERIKELEKANKKLERANKKMERELKKKKEK